MNTDIAWAAGLFEGEGCIYIIKHRKKSATLRLTSTDKDVVERFAQIVGVGNVLLETASRKSHWKPLYLWNISKREEVRRILVSFMPYLGERRKEKAIEALNVMRP